MSEAQNEKKLPSALERARIAARTILENKGEDVRILDLRELTPAFDFFVVASGVSRRQLHAMSEEIDDEFQKKLGDARRGIAGYQDGRWIVLDYGDVVVHLFEPETREFYALEDLWGKGKNVPIEQENRQESRQENERKEETETNDGAASETSIGETSGDGEDLRK